MRSAAANQLAGVPSLQPSCSTRRACSSRPCWRYALAKSSQRRSGACSACKICKTSFSSSGSVSSDTATPKSEFRTGMTISRAAAIVAPQHQTATAMAGPLAPVCRCARAAWPMGPPVTGPTKTWPEARVAWLLSNECAHGTSASGTTHLFRGAFSAYQALSRRRRAQRARTREVTPSGAHARVAAEFSQRVALLSHTLHRHRSSPSGFLCRKDGQRWPEEAVSCDASSLLLLAYNQGRGRRKLLSCALLVENSSLLQPVSVC